MSAQAGVSTRGREQTSLDSSTFHGTYMATIFDVQNIQVHLVSYSRQKLGESGRPVLTFVGLGQTTYEIGYNKYKTMLFL